MQNRPTPHANNSEDFYQLEKKRKNLLEGFLENDFNDPIRRLLQNLYPDQAHYIYELIQNAEDAEASQVRIDLYTDRVEFEHDGKKRFTIDDVDSITAIGRSTKTDDPTSIGKFGVGFKAVFAYTATPQIRSGPFHFRIREMIVPELIDAIDDPQNPQTVFVFPFDAHDKRPEDAFNETYNFLSDLSGHTLLFLRNIRRIEYRRHAENEEIDQQMKLERVERDDPFIDIRSQRLMEHHTVHQYLRFENDVSVEDEGEKRNCPIAVAFRLENGKIVPLEPGRVFIYFPAIKETSNLHFHLHAPFASTVARDSVRDCPANDELRDHLADLAARSMHTIRGLGLLDVPFLSLLPNSGDSLSDYYEPIMKRLISEFKDAPLTPTSTGSHAKASACFRASAGLPDVVSERDLADLLGRDDRLTRWIKNPPQRHQREDRFLSMLDIPEMGVDGLIGALKGSRGLTWLKRRTDEQCQKLLLFLERYRSIFSPSPPFRDVPIVRCRDGEFRPGPECYFLRDGDTEDDDFHYVDSGVYTSLENDDNERAYGFLEKIGVREVGERDQIALVLKRRYGSKTFQPLVDDMIRFVTYFVEANRENEKIVSLFDRYRIFRTADEDENGDAIWAQPNQVFLDAPYCDTGLKAYYDAVGAEKGGRRLLSSVYDNGSIDRQSLSEFATAVGAQTALEHVEQEIRRTHPEWNHLIEKAEGARWTDYYVDVDFVISEFRHLWSNPSEAKSRLIWLTMRDVPEKALKARFRLNGSHPYRVGASTIVHDLRSESWVPQRTDEGIRFVVPAEASSDRLPEGFLFEPGARWLQAIQFGDRAQSEEKADSPRDRERSAQESGFRSADHADKAKRMYEFMEKHDVPFEEFEDFIRQRSPGADTRSKTAEFPQRESRDRAGRRERIRREYDGAPPKEAHRTESEIPRRPMSKETLREWYTNDAQEMVCQICNMEMPFKRRDGLHYFEAVEVLAGRRLPKEHESQYLALCPTCAAKYTEFVKRDPEEMDKVERALIAANGHEISVRLDSTERLRFAGDHLIDVQEILKSIRSESQDGE